MNLLKKAGWYEKLAMELVNKTEKEVEARRTLVPKPLEFVWLNSLH